MSNIINKYITFFVIFGAIIYLFLPVSAVAGPQSTTYEIKAYDFGSGGTTGNTSTTYSLFGNSGQVDGQSLSSTSYNALPGLTYLLQAYTPSAPTLSIPANNYDRIKIVLNTNNNPTDATYAIQVSTTSNFSSNVFYVQTDFTLGTNPVFQTNSTWGTSGFFVTGLTQNTTYYVRAKARQGNYTESPWSQAASQTTGTSSLTFSLSSNAVTFSNLNAGNSYTDSAKSTTLTTSTNAYNGYVVYAWETQQLQTPDGNAIANYASPNSAPTSWTGTGFGYTTSDINLQTGSGGTNRFNNGTQYAGFVTTGPGDPVADDLGPNLNAQTTNENFTISYRVTGSNLTKAGTYTNTILYSIVPNY